MDDGFEMGNGGLDADLGSSIYNDLGGGNDTDAAFVGDLADDNGIDQGDDLGSDIDIGTSVDFDGDRTSNDTPDLYNELGDSIDVDDTDSDIGGDDLGDIDLSVDMGEDITIDVFDDQDLGVMESDTLSTFEGDAPALDTFQRTEDEISTEKYPFDEDGLLKPNIEYTTGEYGYQYKTDANGRISSFKTDNLQLTEREDRLPHNSQTFDKGEFDDAGHLIGDRFGGSPVLDNLVSQDSHVNRSEYKAMENEWADAIRNGSHVEVSGEVGYDSDSHRPSSFNVFYSIDDEVYEKSFTNRRE